MTMRQKHLRNLPGKNHSQDYGQGYHQGHTDAIAEAQRIISQLVLPNEPEEDDVLLLPIEDLEFTPRAYCALKREGIHTIGELVSQSEVDLLDMRNMGPSSISQIRLKLKKFNLVISGDAKLEPITAPPASYRSTTGGRAIEAARVAGYEKGYERARQEFLALLLKQAKKPIILPTIDKLGLSVRTSNALEKNGILSIEDLTGKTQSFVARLPGIGEASMKQIMVAFMQFGLRFKSE